MVEDDVQLIRRILSGDDEAFGVLIQKYRKAVHALAWRKIGDFHYAEEITQDVFLQVYKNLSTLKNPNQFAGWLYVIVNRFCLNWLQRHKPAGQSLEATSLREIEDFSYTCYISEQRETEALERRYAIVKKLLERLPESERTVVTLYYLGEMTTKEIGKFLGVSVNTIKSRLRRARKRLRDDQELLIQQVFGGIQLSENLTSHIMRQIADLKPTPPPTARPLLPWIAFGTATLLTIFLLGASHPYLIRFQQPYSFEAASEPTVDIIDVSLTLNTDSKPNVRNHIRNAISPGRNNSAGLQASETFLATATEVEMPAKFSLSQWIQINGPQGVSVSDFFATSGGILYVATPIGVYRLRPDEPEWILVNTEVPTRNFLMPMAEYGDMLYIVSADDKIFASSDGGETWNAFCPRPKGRHHVGLIVTDASQITRSRTNITMYLAFRDKGIFRSVDAGVRWEPLNEGLTDKPIYAVAAIGNTMFAGTNDGLYRLNSDVWEQVLVDTSNVVHSLTTVEGNLYVGTGPDPYVFGTSTVHIVTREAATPWKIFHSTDLGESWAEITPKNKPSVMMTPRRIRTLVAGKTLLVLDGFLNFRSNDGGQTWTNLGVDRDLQGSTSFPAVAVDENIFYKASTFGIHRTIDGGESWHLFMTGMIGTRVESLIAFKNRLYAHTGRAIVHSIDGGESWKGVPINANEGVLEPIENEHHRVDFSFDSRSAVGDGSLYWTLPEKETLRIFRLSADGKVLIPVQDVPTFEEEILSTELMKAIVKAEHIRLPDAIEKTPTPNSPKALRFIVTVSSAPEFTVSGKTFYVEFRRHLFRWKPGDPKWTNTGLIDLGERPDRYSRYGVKLAVSGEIVYVGKRDGHLFQSLDEGNSWRDVTPILPIRFTRFKEIVFMGSVVYVATDKGVLNSQTGAHWRVLTDRMGARIIIDKFAVDHTRVYGAGDTGVYRLGERDKWEQISPSVPGKVASLVINNNKLYIATKHRGMFQIPLEE